MPELPFGTILIDLNDDEFIKEGRYLISKDAFDKLVIYGTDYCKEKLASGKE